MLDRRGFIRGLFAAPAIVSINSIMPVKLFIPAVGIAPSELELYREMVAITRAAFVPRIFVESYFNSPLVRMLPASQGRSWSCALLVQGRNRRSFVPSSECAVDVEHARHAPALSGPSFQIYTH